MQAPRLDASESCRPEVVKCHHSQLPQSRPWPFRPPDRRSDHLPSRCCPRHARPLAVCSSKGFGKQAQVSAPASAPAPPTSRNSAIAQAVSELRKALGTSGKSKGFSGKLGKRLQIDIPLLDQTSKELLELCRDLIARLPRELAKQVCIGCADIDTALAGSDSLDSQVFALDDDLSELQLSPIILLAAPTSDQIEVVCNLLQRHKSATAILLNAGWNSTQLSRQQQNALQGMRQVYAFLPLGFKGFVKTTEGALLQSGESTWQIFLQEGNNFTCIGQQSKRPSETELELAFYNASAANSPINKGIAGIRSLFGKKAG